MAPSFHSFADESMGEWPFFGLRQAFFLLILDSLGWILEEERAWDVWGFGALGARALWRASGKAMGEVVSMGRHGSGD